jgi:hypothetical protein
MFVDKYPRVFLNNHPWNGGIFGCPKFIDKGGGGGVRYTYLLPLLKNKFWDGFTKEVM